ncbi:Mariner Mos1 transposase [Araneus ventricosus]|uniref:Mariner Mos1 transposase n=1 Tax=Araneus ventricosus TaxID=182803 RepID=A0A4Y2HXL3_ARAVE|nr:Mariner Mos1 transposase [Araneus ventricosus]
MVPREFRDQDDVVYHELLKSSETVDCSQYQQQIVKSHPTLIVKELQGSRRHDKVILFHDNASPHIGKTVKSMLKNVACEALPPLYSPDLAPSDFHLFRSMVHTLFQQYFRS